MPPPVYTHMLRVRYHECDANGHLNNASYVRYMQEAAIEASAALGYDSARFRRMGTAWYIRATDVEYLQPAHYGETVEVRTWTVEFRRVRSQQVYEIRRGDTLLARATSDWVYLDAASGHPRAIPSDVMAAYSGGDPLPARPRPPEPPVPAPPPDVFTLRRRVEWKDIDDEGHANNAAYFDYIGECGVQVTQRYGWTMARMKADGWMLVARQTHMTYLEPAQQGDELDISAWLSDMRRATGVRHFALRRARDGALVAQARTLWVLLNLTTLQPARVPPAVLEAFAPNVSPDSGA